MAITALINKIKQQPKVVEFSEVIDVITRHYHYTPSCFTNGIGENQVINAAGKNEGSCKIFAFAMLHGLSKDETLACFGRYYRDDVIGHPETIDHANIRVFMLHGWDGVHFDQSPLAAK